MRLRKLNFIGNGSSLWGESKGKYSVNDLEIGYVNWVSYPDDKTAPFHASMTLSGPNTQWHQYTDKGIEAGIRKSIVLLVAARCEIQRQLAAAGITRKLPATLQISWSEQGMQPDKGWNFDVSEPRA
jgi:hypothetical protein